MKTKYNCEDSDFFNYSTLVDFVLYAERGRRGVLETQ